MITLMKLHWKSHWSKCESFCDLQLEVLRGGYSSSYAGTDFVPMPVIIYLCLILNNGFIINL